MSRKTMPQPHPLFTILDDPDGVLALDLAGVILKDTHHGLRCEVEPASRGDSSTAASTVTIIETDDSLDYWVGTVAPRAIARFLYELNRWEYPDPIPLASDISKFDDEQMLRIWGDPLARACWVCLRWRRLTNQYFKDAIEWMAGVVRAQRAGGKFTRLSLRNILRTMNEVVGSEENLGILAHRMYPYLAGEREFTFKIETAKAEQ